MKNLIYILIFICFLNYTNGVHQIYTGTQTLTMYDNVRYIHNITVPLDVCDVGIPMLKIYYSILREASADACDDTGYCYPYNITSSFKITLSPKVVFMCLCQVRSLSNPYYLPPINCTDPRAECGLVTDCLNYCPQGGDVCDQICTASLTRVYVNYGNVKPQSVIIPAIIKLDYYTVCYEGWLGWNWPDWGVSHYSYCP